MQTGKCFGVLQTKNRKWEKNINPNSGRGQISGISPNHRQAERKLITLVGAKMFEIDDMGCIWRLRKCLGCRWHGTKNIEVLRQRAEHRIPSGYLQVRATISGKRIHGFAHRLVWQYFFGNISSEFCINHKNGIKDDNSPDNLELVTYSENNKHAYNTGLMRPLHGEKNSKAMLTNNKAKKIREMYAKRNISQKIIAEQTAIPFQTVSKIIRGEAYRDAGGPICIENRKSVFKNRDRLTGKFI